MSDGCGSWRVGKLEGLVSTSINLQAKAKASSAAEDCVSAAPKSSGEKSVIGENLQGFENLGGLKVTSDFPPNHLAIGDFNGLIDSFARF